MADPNPCPFCEQAPAMNHAGQADGPQYWWLTCVSEACAMRVVETKKCGDPESAIGVWNERVA